MMGRGHDLRAGQWAPIPSFRREIKVGGAPNGQRKGGGTRIRAPLKKYAKSHAPIMGRRGREGLPACPAPIERALHLRFMEPDILPYDRPASLGLSIPLRRDLCVVAL